MKKILFLSGLLIAVAGAPLASAATISFTAQDVKDAMGIPLNDSTYQWGLWAVRARPVVTGGGYTVTSGSGSTDQTGWGTDVPSWYSWSGYGANIAWFWDASGSEVVGNPANPLYMIMDQPANTFTSYGFDPDGTFDPTPEPGEINVVTAVSDSSSFAFSFALDAGASWTGDIQFLVDGSKYTLGTAGSPGVWVEDFFGNYGTGGGLTGNTGSGYGMHVPDAGSTLLLLGSALTGLAILKRRFQA